MWSQSDSRVCVLMQFVRVYTSRRHINNSARQKAHVYINDIFEAILEHLLKLDHHV